MKCTLGLHLVFVLWYPLEELGKNHPFACLHSEARIQKNVGLILKLSLVCHALLKAVYVCTNAVGADTPAEDRKFAFSPPHA